MQLSHARLLPFEGKGTVYGDRSLPSAPFNLQNPSNSCNSAGAVQLRFHACPEGFKMKSGDVDHGGSSYPETKRMWAPGEVGWLNG